MVKSGTISSYLAENAALRMYSVAKPEDGVFASTGYKVLRESKTRSLLELELHTGKKNQIRVHLSEKGHPILGDRKYGDKTPGIQRLALHATTLRLNHPHTKEPMVFQAPVPDYFAALMR